MKKRYDAVIVGGGVAGYALASLCAKAGHILFFENEDPPVDPPWTRPLFATAEHSVWQTFTAAAGWKAGPAAGYRFQLLNGRERDDGRAQPAKLTPGFEPAAWLARQLEWPAWYIRWWRSLVAAAPVPESTIAPPWSAVPLGYSPRDKGVLAYLGATVDSWQTPETEIGEVLRKLRALAAAEGAEFLPIARFEGLDQGGIRVQGAGRVIETPRVAACLDLGQWTQAPGLGPLPRKVFRHVRPEGVRVRVRWACDERELPAGLAGRGWWADEPRAFFEITGEGSAAALSVWHVSPDATRVDARDVAGQLLKVVRGYAPFFRGSVESAQIDTHPVWQSTSRDGGGVPPVLNKVLAYAGAQSFPGWGVEGELAAAMRLHRLWFPPAL